MFIKPEKIAFETKEDIIDYVSKGYFPPKKENFKKVMNKVRKPDEAGDVTLEAKRGKEVIIDNTIIPEEDRKSFEEVLTRVHKNRVSNRNDSLIGLALGAVALTLFSIFKPKQ